MPVLHGKQPQTEVHYLRIIPDSISTRDDKDSFWAEVYIDNGGQIVASDDPNGSAYVLREWDGISDLGHAEMDWLLSHNIKPKEQS